MKTSRLEAFSDGVLAIIITIMVLELKAPTETDLKALLAKTPVFFKLYFQFYIFRYLLEQSSSPVSNHTESEWQDTLGKSTFAFLVIISSFYNSLDRRTL